MEFLTAFVVIVWISGALGLWAYIAEKADKAIPWWEHIVLAIFGLYWPVFVPGVTVYRYFNEMPDNPKSELT